MFEIYDQVCTYRNTSPWFCQGYYDFSWKLRGNVKRQKKCRVTIIDKNENVVWSTGMVESFSSHNISCPAVYLEKRQEYMWLAESWGEGNSYACGQLRLLETYLLDADEWQAKWIETGYMRKPCIDIKENYRVFTGDFPKDRNPADVLNKPWYVRKEFDIPDKVSNARAYISARGIYRIFINGRDISHLLAPGYTAYGKHIDYQIYDITRFLVLGRNTVAAMIGDGWYCGKIGLMGIGNQYGETTAFLMQIEIYLQDGRQIKILSDQTMKWNFGGYLYGDLFVGEYFDGEKEPDGWKENGFNDSGWQAVQEKEYGFEELYPSTFHGEILDIFLPEKIFSSPLGECIIDAGKVTTGYLEVAVTGNKGDEISFEYCEQLDKDGNFFHHLIGQNKDQKDVYRFAATETAVYYPVFSYHGFRYVKYTGTPALSLKDIRIIEIGTALKKSGGFQCSDIMLEQLQKNIYNSQRGNMLFIPTDCPQRERAGWTGDMQVFCATACFNMDMEMFLRRWLWDMRQEQLPDGQVPNTVPWIPSNELIENNPSEEKSSAGWGDACIIIPWILYQEYGDLRILEENFLMMKKWLKYAENCSRNKFPEGTPQEEKIWRRYLWDTGSHFGDWLIPSLAKAGNPPQRSAYYTKEITASAMFAYSTSLMGAICRILHKENESRYYFNLSSNIKSSFIRAYVDGCGVLKSDFQGCYILALYMGLIPADLKGKYMRRLVTLIHENGDCLDTGFMSVPYLLDVLYENGEQELAYKLLFQTKCPSWLYEVKQGATSLWEWWDNIDIYGKPKVSSYNHFAFGCVGNFIYRRILGLYALKPGYSHIQIRPDFSCGLSFVKGCHETVFGKISIQWSRYENLFELYIELPPGVEAHIVAGEIDDVIDVGGKYQWKGNLKVF